MAAPGSPIAPGLRAIAPIALLAFAAVILFRYPPQRFGFYPPCPVYVFFHLQCPGCGATRALAALLHGHLREALRFNALFVLALPFAVFWSTRNYLRFPAEGRFRWPGLSQPAICTALLLTAFFTIARNL